MFLAAMQILFLYFAPIFHPVMHFNVIAIVYYYSPGGSTRLDGVLSSLFQYRLRPVNITNNYRSKMFYDHRS